MVYTYDIHNNLTKQTTFIKYEPDEEWILSNEFIFTNEYDDEDRLVKKTRERFFYPISGGPPEISEQYYFEKEYSYLCSDVVNREDSEFHVGTLTFRKDFYYEGKNECFEIENIMLEMSVFPNPSFGEVTIQSPILESGNTQILVFDVNGKLLLEKNELQRDDVSLDLSFLPNGMYVIQLMNQEHFIQNKIVLAK